jgi:hypothetical protein
MKVMHEFVEAKNIWSEQALGWIGSYSVDEYLLCTWRKGKVCIQNAEVEQCINVTSTQTKCVTHQV